jgi:hypothetical protein
LGLGVSQEGFEVHTITWRERGVERVQEGGAFLTERVFRNMKRL